MILTDVRSERHPVLDFFVTEGTVEGETVDVITFNVLPDNQKTLINVVMKTSVQPDVMLHLPLLPAPGAAPHDPALQLQPHEVLVCQSLHF